MTDDKTTDGQKPGTPASEAFAARLHAEAKPRGWRQVDLCNVTGISVSSLSTYWRGARLPERKQADKLATALGVRVAWLLYGEAGGTRLEPGAAPVERQEVRVPVYERPAPLPIVDDRPTLPAPGTAKPSFTTERHATGEYTLVIRKLSWQQVSKLVERLERL